MAERLQLYLHRKHRGCLAGFQVVCERALLEERWKKNKINDPGEGLMPDCSLYTNFQEVKF